ncbi:riboflavin biosynthesis protein RibF [Candidatus Endolissoclinum faulkneri L2]|uniref:Riboflavin biosynthesis protein n=1 Tax=Candidatus Endolissoclinum faulkneri L2 TaxID=1193729 RepID=K7YSW3_9PROT|nr:bifunctional riboflavin kinase/FAD synthetase [Candidatus Endolissoclinum faulkneri]AFX99674.1 riboflavin biosynthesis protein RibF [Candidatus Endolissoclinum faulkneri L2]
MLFACKSKSADRRGGIALETMHSLKAIKQRHRGSVAVIGNFDGVHLGHRAVISEASKIAYKLRVPLSVVTFAIHPRQLFQRNLDPFRLSTSRSRAKHLENLGVDTLFELPFDKEFAQLSPEKFIDEILLKYLGLRHIVIGYDFNFGYRRRGTPDMLIQCATHKGFGVTKVAAVQKNNGAVYSSSRIRQCLVEGDPREAASLLGAPWEITATVEEGDRRGRLIGFPTANLRLGDLLRPRLGVYAVTAMLTSGKESGIWMPGVANIGIRPTVNDKGVILEVYLFDKKIQLYSRDLRVGLVDFIRPEQKFISVDDLTKQINSDASQARKILKQ